MYNLFLNKINFFQIIIIVFCVLLLTNLGNQYMWQDEAQTCLISKTIMQKGLPFGTDGINFFSQELGAEYGENYIWKWHTWLPFYIQAIFFWLFGLSNFVARLPFALLGVASGIYTYLLSKKIFNKDTGNLSLILLVTNVGFLVLSRQARLYSPSIFFSIASIYYFILLAEETGKLWSKNKTILFIIFTTFIFHTHYFYYGTFFISIGFYLLFFDRNNIKQFVIPTIISGVLNLPWVIWFRDLKYAETYGYNFNYNVIRQFAESYLYATYKHILGGYSFIIFLFICIVILIYFRKKIEFKINSILLLLIFVIINFIFLIVFTPTHHYRYLSVIIIPCILLMSYLADLSSNVHKWTPYVLVVFLIFFSPFNDYLYEITHDYDGPLEGISKYLNKNANKDDEVLITYGDLPVKWHTGLKTFGGLTGENLGEAKSPEWVINRKYTICDKDQKIKNFIDQQIDLTNYNKIEINYPDYIFENREDPEIRIFRMKKEDNVILYQKK